MKRVLGTLAAITLGTAALLPAQAFARVDVNLVIGNAPPPARYEVIPAPRNGYEWAPGYWSWDGRRHVWIPGHWEQLHVGEIYEPAMWIQVGNGWQLRPGGWRPREEVRYVREHPNRHARGYGYGNGYGDRDHDGIPNRYDRDRDGDGVPNRHDRDRDGDGVPNRYDRRPDDGRRY